MEDFICFCNVWFTGTYNKDIDSKLKSGDNFYVLCDINFFLSFFLFKDEQIKNITAVYI